MTEDTRINKHLGAKTEKEHDAIEAESILDKVREGITQAEKHVQVGQISMADFLTARAVDDLNKAVEEGLLTEESDEYKRYRADLTALSQKIAPEEGIEAYT